MTGGIGERLATIGLAPNRGASVSFDRSAQDFYSFVVSVPADFNPGPPPSRIEMP